MDISKLATKTDLKTDIKGLRADFKELKSDYKSIRHELLRVEGKVENIEDDVKDIKVILNKMSNTLDGFVSTVDDLRTDNTVGTHHTRELQIKTEDHEKRILAIESSKQAA